MDRLRRARRNGPTPTPSVPTPTPTRRSLPGSLEGAHGSEGAQGSEGVEPDGGPERKRRRRLETGDSLIPAAEAERACVLGRTAGSSQQAARENRTDGVSLVTRTGGTPYSKG